MTQLQLAETNENLIQPSAEEIIQEYARTAKERQVLEELRKNEFLLAEKHRNEVGWYRKIFLMVVKEKFSLEERDICDMSPHIRQVLWENVRRDIETKRNKRHKRTNIITLSYLGVTASVCWYFGFDNVMMALISLFSIPLCLFFVIPSYSEGRKLNLIKTYDTYFKEALPEFVLSENKSSD